ncbi:MAG: hypothetical protein ACI35Q_02285, partial [Marinilabiliaceae bacterium]
ERAWAFLDPRLIDNIVYIRTGIAKPVVANTWNAGGVYSQRGFRCNLCPLPTILPLQMQPYFGCGERGDRPAWRLREPHIDAHRRAAGRGVDKEPVEARKKRVQLFCIRLLG